MKNIQILFIIMLFSTLASCGYSRINNNISDFEIQNIIINGDKKISYILKNNISLISKISGPKKYEIKINLSNSKKSKIKDVTGRTTRFSSTLIADINLKNLNNQEVINKSFFVENDFDVSSSHGDTVRNEKNSIENNVNRLSDEISKFIQLINLN
tara:strand:- start:156 stop:623 length:468 start_codon:yes stop_codon:yes gene_type:complete